MNEEEEIVLPAITGTFKCLNDGTIRLTVEIEPAYRVWVAKFYGERGLPIALARIGGDSAKQMLQEKSASTYGDHARTLRLSSFFRSPKVWAAIGSDKDFLAWLRTQKCAFCGHEKNEYVPIEAAHVRRVANGAGVAIKPEYSAIPLCHDCHAKQHQHGESILGGKEWFDKKRIEYLFVWSWNSLKAILGYESWGEVAPEKLLSWADLKGISEYLPAIYKNPLGK
jgi:hypothetical protein